jgi:hypothetical protein
VSGGVNALVNECRYDHFSSYVFCNRTDGTPNVLSNERYNEILGLEAGARDEELVGTSLSSIEKGVEDSFTLKTLKILKPLNVACRIWHYRLWQTCYGTDPPPSKESVVYRIIRTKQEDS